MRRESRWSGRTGIAVIAGLLVGCELLLAPKEEVVLPVESRPGRWITIEFANPSCPPIDRGMSRKFVVSASGYACTSSQMDRGWVHLVYSAYDSGGRRIDVADKIHQRHTFETLTSATKDGIRGCRPEAWMFWYGDPDRMAGDSAGAYRQRHPECP